ncbi:MAG: nucleoside triphosphate pyrophosphohydrolase [Spirochaetales bacterium]|nr:nucleoside triphosphate pyrophosphohydrolase [Spirochaetales bacterium]
MDTGTDGVRAIGDAFNLLFDLVRKLRGPDGCPWDREQTPNSMKQSLVEEVYECIDAIENGDDQNLLEELGDLYLIVTMIAFMKQQDGSFLLSAVFSVITQKLIRRHPHVFGNAKVTNSHEVIKQWEKIKHEVEGKPKDILSSIPNSLPSLERAYKIQRKAANVGFDWPDLESVWKKITEEVEEIERSKSYEDLKEELGDLLFSVVNYCRRVAVNPDEALRNANKKFLRRFRYIENCMEKMGKSPSAEEFELMDQLWEKAKSAEL